MRGHNVLVVGPVGAGGLREELDNFPLGIDKREKIEKTSKECRIAQTATETVCDTGMLSASPILTIWMKKAQFFDVFLLDCFKARKGFPTSELNWLAA